jgi:hypothetical protein
MSELLADWYFVRCAQLSAEDQSATLEDLQRLRTPWLDPQLVRAAIRRLVHRDRRVRAYAIPAIAHLIASTPWEEVRADAIDVLTSIASDGNRRVRDAVHDLAYSLATETGDGVDNRMGVTQFVRRLSVVAREAVEVGSLEEHTPYFRTALATWPLLTLALARELATDEDRSDALRQRFDEDPGVAGDPLARVLWESRSGRFGRRGLLVVLDLLAQTHGERTALSELRTVRNTTLDGRAEPDLLVQAASLLALFPDEVLDEVGTMDELAALDRRVPMDTLTASFRRRIGIGASNPALPQFAPLVWQTAVARPP